MNELLKPTLEGTERRPFYSMRATFWVAFLGGPIAITFFSALNSRHLGRWKKEWPLYAGFLFVSLLFIWVAFNPPSDPNAIREWAAARKRDPMLKFGVRIAGVVVWGVFTLFHRPLLKAQEMLDIKPLNPWKAGILCTLAATAISLLIVAIKWPKGL